MDFHTAERHLYPQSRCSGIYIIRNTVTGKAYVGSAMGFAHRIQVHATRLRNGKPKSEETKQRMRDAQARRREARVLATEPMG